MCGSVFPKSNYILRRIKTIIFMFSVYFLSFFMYRLFWTSVMTPFKKFHNGSCLLFFFLFNILFISEGWREEREGGEAEREGDKIWSKIQALSCQHRTRLGAQTHKLWDHNLSGSWTLNQLSNPGSLVATCSDKNYISNMDKPKLIRYGCKAKLLILVIWPI